MGLRCPLGFREFARRENRKGRRGDRSRIETSPLLHSRPRRRDLTLSDRYPPGTHLTFTNGFVGAVTKFATVVLVSPQGWVTPAKRAPKLDYILSRPGFEVKESSRDCPVQL